MLHDCAATLTADRLHTPTVFTRQPRSPPSPRRLCGQAEQALDLSYSDVTDVVIVHSGFVLEARARVDAPNHIGTASLKSAGLPCSSLPRAPSRCLGPARCLGAFAASLLWGEENLSDV